mgnify:CR=1 FL=1
MPPPGELALRERVRWAMIRRMSSERSATIPEFTLKAVFTGVVLGIVFGAANAYLGLRVGMTVSASIPAAVMTVAAFRVFRADGTILEANLSQTIGSASSSVASGVLFTIPALFMWGLAPALGQGFVQVGQRQVPAVIVGDGDGIVEAVHRREHGLQAEVLAQYPVFVEVGGVPDLPAQGIHNRQSGPHQLRRIQPVDERKRAPAGVFHAVDQEL